MADMLFLCFQMNFYRYMFSMLTLAALAVGVDEAVGALVAVRGAAPAGPPVGGAEPALAVPRAALVVARLQASENYDE